MKTLQLVVLMIFVSVNSFSVLANNTAQASEKPEATIKRMLESSRSDVKVDTIAPSEIEGLYAVQMQNGPLVYATADGKHFVLGDIYEVQPKDFVNLGELRRNQARVKELAAVKLDDMIVFKAKGTTKAVINVFTDVDCGFCQKLHKEVPQLNELGIEVRYLAFPRAGLGSESYQKLVTAWCSKDRQVTLTRYKNHENIPFATCADNPVGAEYALGGRIGVSGTPALVTAKGELMPGYMPAQQLAQKLGVH